MIVFPPVLFFIQQISESDLLSADSREKLYKTLLSSCSNVDHFWALSQVLNVWPQQHTEL